MMPTNHRAENLHANMPTVAVDYTRPRWAAYEADPVSGTASIAVFPGHEVTAGGRRIAISAEAVAAAIGTYEQMGAGGVNRVFAVPGMTVDGHPAALRMASNRMQVVSEVTEAMVASTLVDAYHDAVSSGASAPDRPRFAPLEIAGVVNVPTTVPAKTYDLYEDEVQAHSGVESRAAILMPLINGQTLQAQIEQGVPLSAAQTKDLIEGLDRWIAVASTQGYVHTDLKPANIMVGDDGSLVPIDHTIASAACLVSQRAGLDASNVKFTPYWHNGPGIERALDHYITFQDGPKLTSDLAACQRATAARIALTGFMGQELMTTEAYHDGELDRFAAMNTPSCYEPALRLAQQRGLDAISCAKLRTYLHEGLKVTSGAAPALEYYK